MSHAESQLNESLNDWMLVPFFSFSDNSGSIHGTLDSLGKITKEEGRCEQKIWRIEHLSNGIWRPRSKERTFHFDYPEHHLTKLPEGKHMNSVTQGAGISLSLERHQK